MKYMLDKVFEALEILSRALEFNDEGEFQSGRLWRIIFNDMVDDKEKSIIEQALTELKAIKEAKPSEALKLELETLLERANHDELLFRKDTEFCENFLEENQKYFDTINQALLKSQEQGNVLNWIIKHLSFEDGGVGVVDDFITGKRETKYFIKVKSKDTGATIHIHLDTEEESKLLKRYFDNENNK